MIGSQWTHSYPNECVWSWNLPTILPEPHPCETSIRVSCVSSLLGLRWTNFLTAARPVLHFPVPKGLAKWVQAITDGRACFTQGVEAPQNGTARKTFEAKTLYSKHLVQQKPWNLLMFFLVRKKPHCSSLAVRFC